MVLCNFALFDQVSYLRRSKSFVGVKILIIVEPMIDFHSPLTKFHVARHCVGLRLNLFLFGFTQILGQLGELQMFDGRQQSVNLILGYRGYCIIALLQLA